jgi:plastocyanin
VTIVDCPGEQRFYGVYCSPIMKYRSKLHPFAYRFKESGAAVCVHFNVIRQCRNASVGRWPHSQPTRLVSYTSDGGDVKRLASASLLRRFDAVQAGPIYSSFPNNREEMNMKQQYRFLIALALLLTGLALVPYIGLSAEPSGEQRYADADEPAPVQVAIQNFAFSPAIVTVTTGTTVRWVNMDNVDHTVTSNGGIFDSGNLSPSNNFEVLFDTAGTYPYFCTLHPAMTGQIVVVDVPFDVYLPAVFR